MNNKSENDSKVSAVLISMRDADNISFIQTTSDWSLDEVSANCVSNMQASELRHRLMQYILVWDRMDTVTTLKQGERYKILKYYDPIEGTSYMDCYGSLSNGTFFLMSTPLEAVQDSAQISNQFFMFTCLGGMLLALIVISVISNRLTRPLLQLAEIADHMANLDFTSKYTGDIAKYHTTTATAAATATNIQCIPLTKPAMGAMIRATTAGRIPLNAASTTAL